MEGVILFKHNKTGNWLKSKTEKEKKDILIACIKVGREQRRIFQERKREVVNYREKQLQEREKFIEKRKSVEKKKKLDLCLKIASDTYWRTSEEGSVKLQGLSESKRKEALKTQIKFRQFVLKQTYEDKTVFNFSQNRKQFTSAKLFINLV